MERQTLDTGGLREALRIFGLVCDLVPSERELTFAEMDVSPEVQSEVRALLVRDEESSDSLTEQSLQQRRAALERLLKDCGPQ